MIKRLVINVVSTIFLDHFKAEHPEQVEDRRIQMKHANQNARIPFGLAERTNVFDSQKAVECDQHLHIGRAKLEY
jgi:hypothetical protein